MKTKKVTQKEKLLKKLSKKQSSEIKGGASRLAIGDRCTSLSASGDRCTSV